MLSTKRLTRAFLASLVTASPFLYQDSVLGQVFDALCEGDTKCKIIVGDQLLSAGSTNVPANRIISWGETEAKSKRKPELCLLSITACALTIFHDYRYYVDYATADGELRKLDFRFINDKPAKQLSRKLTSLTNLASGQTSEKTASWADARRGEVKYQKFVESLNCSPTLKPYKCSYNTYLESNPAAKAWAKANPSLIQSQMVLMKAIEVLPKP